MLKDGSIESAERVIFGNSSAPVSSGGVSTAGAIGAMVSVLSKGGAAITVEENENEVTGAAVPERPAVPKVNAGTPSSSGVAVGTVVETSTDETIGGPPLEGANLHP